MSLVNRSHRTGARERGDFGFTLPELLVAITIFVSVMSGVGLLFVNGLRVMRQGFQNQEIFEQSRSTLKIIEQDLSRAFASRDFGEYYSFYGTPIGMSFVGVVAPRDGAEANLSRVTYVIYHDPDPNLADIQNPVDVDENGSITTYRLLRFVEPGETSLDDLPVDWYAVELDIPEFSAFPAGSTLGTLLDDAIDRYELSPDAIPCRACLYPDEIGFNTSGDVQRIAVVNAKKRELWIRLLSGGDPLTSFGGAGYVPSGWEIQSFLNSFGQPVIDFNPASTDFENPNDYIVAENLLHTYIPINPDLDDFNLPQSWPAILAGEGVSPDDPFPADTYIPSYFFLYNGYREVFDTNLGKTVIAPIQVRYWNDPRNALREFPGNFIDDDNDTIIDEVNIIVGSPFEPHIPQEIATFFTFFYESPYPGAPDFRRRFDQRIDIPTGYRRFQTL